MYKLTQDRKKMSKFEIHELALGLHLGPTDRATTQGALGVFLFGGLLSSA